MKRMLLLLVSILLITSAASASLISIYSDSSGGSCVLAQGFNPNVTIIEKFSIGSVGSRFSMTIDTNQFAFSTLFTTIGFLTSEVATESTTWGSVKALYR